MNRPHDANCAECDQAEFSGQTYESTHARCGNTSGSFVCDRETGHVGAHRGYDAQIDEPVFWLDVQSVRVGDRIWFSTELLKQLWEDESANNMVLTRVREIRLEHDGTKTLALARAVTLVES